MARLAPTYLPREPHETVLYRLQAWRDQAATLRLVDDDAGSWAHLIVDDVVLYDRPLP